VSKIEELQSLDRQVKEQLQNHGSAVEKAVKNPAVKLSESEKKIVSLKQELALKMKQVMSCLNQVV